LDRELEINKRLAAEFEYDLENNKKSLKDRPPRPGADLREGMSRRYPELSDPSYVQSMKDALPLVTPTTEQLERQMQRLSTMPLSSNTNVQVSRSHAAASRLENVFTNDELESLI